MQMLLIGAAEGPTPAQGATALAMDTGMADQEINEPPESRLPS